MDEKVVWTKLLTEMKVSKVRGTRHLHPNHTKIPRGTMGTKNESLLLHKVITSYATHYPYFWKIVSDWVQHSKAKSTLAQ